MDDDFNKLTTISELEFLDFVRKFYEKNSNSFTFPDLDLDKRQKLVTEIFTRLRPGNFETNSINICLKSLRLLTREREGLDAITGSSVLEPLQRLAGLECSKVDVCPIDVQNVIEAEKCMSNLIYMSPGVQKFYSVSGVADAITQRIKETTTKLHSDIRFYDMRILFLLTALNPDIRQRIREKFHGLSYLFEIINQIMHNRETLAAADSNIVLSNEDVDYLIEILKTLFNLTVDLPNITHSYALQEEEEEAHLQRLVSILRELLLCFAQNSDKQFELQNHIINLLTNMPKTCFEELLTPVNDDESEDSDYEYEGKNMEAINIILQFLDYRIIKQEEMKASKDALLPVLQLLIIMCQSNRNIRKFCRRHILPPLGEEIMNLPTEGQKLRNKLTRMMTSPNSELKTFSAKLLFVLCKENVDRLIKYTGIGNAAGLLYDFGLLGPPHNTNKDQYSSESEDSDTDIYKRSIDRINRITGSIDPPKEAGPMDDWSEEHKEREIMKLVDNMQRAMDIGIIQPATIGPDGKPIPIKSVLQFRETVELRKKSNDLLPSESSGDELSEDKASKVTTTKKN
ncbi:unnamed protein product [Didymodactylos carnosus]|uniref:Synembryn-A n=1 Tax=Didymodactylos carnosus TaxID=1234261 RepID=A0A814BEB9_9BILA|nr:unnamed protein product [Didymodactylos carnosus]CAF3703704.1 unnamed protein product [Didymodactylos carnosus]